MNQDRAFSDQVDLKTLYPLCFIEPIYPIMEPPEDWVDPVLDIGS